MPLVEKAIIIGAGPAGLAAAIRLTKNNNVNCTIYELRPKIVTLGGAVGIGANGLRLLHQLGVYDALLDLASASADLKVHSTDGSVIWDVDLASWVRPRTGFGQMRVKRRDLVHVLHNAVTELQIPVHFDRGLTEIVESENHVTVRFSDGSEDSADLLLGCDGIHSATRMLQVDQLTKPEYSGVSNIFGIVSLSDLQSRANLDPGMHVTFVPDGMFAVVTCNASFDQVYWFYSTKVPIPEEGDTRDGWEAYGAKDVEGFKNQLLHVLKDVQGGWGDTLRQLVESCDAFKFYPVYKLPLNGRYFSKRCLLLGDAAHAMPPHVGQGVSMALEDIFLLSRLLEAESTSLEKIFARFEDIRRPRIKSVAQAATERGKARTQVDPRRLWMRETATWMAFWVYKTLRLNEWGVGLAQPDWMYDITKVPI